MKNCLGVFICSVLFFVSCKPLSFKKSATNSVAQVTLGSVGTVQTKFLKKEFTPTAFPSYEQSVKVSVHKKTFTKKLYKAFIANGNYHSVFKKKDSLNSPHYYLNIALEDPISLLENLNNPKNETLIAYLGRQEKSSMVYQISLVFSVKDMEALQAANTIFLVEKSSKNYALQVYDESQGIQKSISLHEGVVLDYKTAAFCWQENARHQLEIVDVVQHDGCPPNTFTNPLQAKKEAIDFSKF